MVRVICNCRLDRKLLIWSHGTMGVLLVDLLINMALAFKILGMATHIPLPYQTHQMLCQLFFKLISGILADIQIVSLKVLLYQPLPDL